MKRHLRIVSLFLVAENGIFSLHVSPKVPGQSTSVMKIVSDSSGQRFKVAHEVVSIVTMVLNMGMSRVISIHCPVSLADRSIAPILI